MLYLLLFFHQVLAKENMFVGVSTQNGVIVGQLVKSRYGALTVFYGVPYALVNENDKFGEALPYPNFTMFRALNTSESCPHNYGGVIQCLTLNIIVPIIKSNIHPFPVLIWFFGGFMMRNPNDYDGRHIAKHGVIIVTVNYRLGPYGFFCLDGIKNQGLKDQSRAIKWVKDNIEPFGGDPRKITIGGQSYGGGAVDFHLYEKDRHFNRAIIQSGSRFSKGITVRKDNTAPIKIANYFGSETTETAEALKLLNRLDPVTVMSAVKNMNMKFGVCKDIYNYVGHIKDTEIIIGYNSNEDLATYALKPKQFYKELGDNIFFDYLSQNFKSDDATLNMFAKLVKKFYLGSTNISQDSVLGLADFSSDTKLNFAVERSVKKCLSYNATKVYKYLFSYTGRSPYKALRGVGASHAEELEYLFEKNSYTFNAEQSVLRDRMTEMWANFIKYGNPNLLKNNNKPAKEVWLPTNLEKRYYLNIDKEIFLGEHLLHKRMAFWELLRSYYTYLIIDKAIDRTTEDPIISNTLICGERNKHILNDKDSTTPNINEVFRAAMKSVIEDPKLSIVQADEHQPDQHEANEVSIVDSNEVVPVKDITPVIDKHGPTSTFSQSSITEEPTTIIINNDELATTSSPNETIIENKVMDKLPVNDERDPAKIVPNNYELTTIPSSNETIIENSVMDEFLVNDEQEPAKIIITNDELTTTPSPNEMIIEHSMTNKLLVNDEHESNTTPAANEVYTEDFVMAKLRRDDDYSTPKTNKVSTEDSVMTKLLMGDEYKPVMSLFQVNDVNEPLVTMPNPNEVDTEDPAMIIFSNDEHKIQINEQNSISMENEMTTENKHLIEISEDSDLQSHDEPEPILQGISRLIDMLRKNKKMY